MSAIIKRYSTKDGTLTDRIYAARGCVSSKDLDKSLSNLIHFSELKGIDDAAKMIVAGIMAGSKFLIVGDYDVDGATSTVVALRGLKMMGATSLRYLVPSRFKFGYGLTQGLAVEAWKQTPDIIITVDNGSSSHDGIKQAQDLGMKVIVTDHHLPAEFPTTADAEVNPNQVGCSFPSKSLAGVGVIFYLMLAVRDLLTKNGRLPEGVNLATLLDLAALGTVADVVPLDRNNRILVHQGLERMKQGLSCEGVKALIKVSGRSVRNIEAADMGFSLGPRINAAGRLEDMSIGIECLMSDNSHAADFYAKKLDQLNVERRLIAQQMQDSAEKITAGLSIDTSEARGICLHQKEWHQGVIGILASRVKDKFYAPTICFTSDGDIMKGSARSIKGLHIRDAIAKVQQALPGAIITFGGHAMAAGLTIHASRLKEFSHEFNKACIDELGQDDVQEIKYSDGDLQAPELSLIVAENLKKAGPWGQGFLEPSFDGEFRVKACRVLSGKHLKMVVDKKEGPQGIDAIAFNQGEGKNITEGSYIHLLYKLDVNDFRGERKLQIIVDNIRYLKII